MVFQLTKRLAFRTALGDPTACWPLEATCPSTALSWPTPTVSFPGMPFVKKVIQWWCPLQRFVIFPEEIHISHSMRTLMNKDKYKVTFNHAFEQVIRNCSKLRIEQEGAWLGEEMIEAYIRMYEQNLAASVEVWEGDKLVGGLYGVTLGTCFFGESMFSLVPSASKLALIRLAQLLHAHGGTLIDCQFETPHLKSMGGRFISYEEYMECLKAE